MASWREGNRRDAAGSARKMDAEAVGQQAKE